ncbi:MAG: adenine deaminase [Candidatus Mcinerneyibacterium aminivorans]|uniref:Adenine deaminase n=1 Tax=Candidatus Mcinerneyibacterium aminivorans TaxID=2703815 RepID=A0A5D0MJ88_9BACT|nr:MAG: adenine deaminase [Candidatus Mcinerneyibacterium aminivorans]
MKMIMDLKLENANLINIFTSKIYKTNIFIKNGIIWGFDGNYTAKKTINCDNKFVSPSFIEGHIHLESSHVTPQQLYSHFLKNGVTTVVCDPHEIANVAGVEGIKFLINRTRKLPIDFYFQAPSCVPASSLETVHEDLGIDKLKKLKEFPEIIGLGEIMDYPSVINKNKKILSKIELFSGMLIDGHAPGLSGKKLDSYIRHGIYSDHECVGIDEAKEKMQKGMHIMIREGSSAKNMDLIKLINNKNDDRFMLVTDDISPKDLYNGNFILDKMKNSVEKYDIDPILLLKGMTYNPANFFRFKKKGGVAPGYIADLAIFDDIKTFKLNTVIKNGKILYENGKIAFQETNTQKTYIKKNNFKIKKFNPDDFKIKDKNKKIRIIKLIENNIITDEEKIKLESKNGYLKTSVDNDIIKLSVIERYTGNSNYSTGYIKGTNLKKGALASSYNHDSHNIVVVGTNDKDMAFAVNKLKSMGGGIIFVFNQNVIEKIPLPIYGIMSNELLKKIANRYENLEKKLKQNGVKLKNPLSTLSFLALSVIPKLKINDRGLIDVDNFQVVDLYV